MWGDYRQRKQDLMGCAEEETMNSSSTENLSQWLQSAGLWGGLEGAPPGRGAVVLGGDCPPGEQALKEPRHLSPSEQSSSGLTADTVSCSRCKLAAPRTSLSSDSATQRSVGTGGGGRGAAWVPGPLHTSCPPAAQMPLLGRGPGAAPLPPPPPPAPQ